MLSWSAAVRQRGLGLAAVARRVPCSVAQGLGQERTLVWLLHKGRRSRPRVSTACAPALHCRRRAAHQAQPGVAAGSCAARGSACQLRHRGAACQQGGRGKGGSQVGAARCSAALLLLLLLLLPAANVMPPRVAVAGCQRRLPTVELLCSSCPMRGGGGGHSLATPVPVPPCATLGRAHAVSCRLATAAPTAAPPTAAGPWRSSCLAHPSRPCCRRRCWQGRASLGRQTLRWRLWRRRTPALRPRRSCCARSWRRRPAMRSRHCSTCR